MNQPRIDLARDQGPVPLRLPDRGAPLFATQDEVALVAVRAVRPADDRQVLRVLPRPGADPGERLEARGRAARPSDRETRRVVVRRGHAGRDLRTCRDDRTVRGGGEASCWWTSATAGTCSRSRPARPGALPRRRCLARPADRRRPRGLWCTRRRDGVPSVPAAAGRLRAEDAEGRWVVYPKDVGAILVGADVFPGARVAGGRHGFWLAHAGAVPGHRSRGPVVSYDLRPEFQRGGGSEHRVVLREGADWLELREGDVRDVAGSGEIFDRAIFDLPEPWGRSSRSRPCAARGRDLLRVPADDEPGATARARLASATGTEHLETFEVLHRSWHVTARSVRPDQRMVGHTGFITLARRVRSDRLAHGSGDNLDPMRRSVSAYPLPKTVWIGQETSPPSSVGGGPEVSLAHRREVKADAGARSTTNSRNSSRRRSTSSRRRSSSWRTRSRSSAAGSRTPLARSSCSRRSSSRRAIDLARALAPEREARRRAAVPSGSGSRRSREEVEKLSQPPGVVRRATSAPTTTARSTCSPRAARCA